MNEMTELKANLGLLLRGDLRSLTSFLDRLPPLLRETGVQLVHKQASASKLWIMEGEKEAGS